MTQPINTAIDLETDGVNEYPLEPWRRPYRVRLLALATTADPDMPTMRILSEPIDMRKQLADFAGRLVTGWNLTYDIACLLSAGFDAEVRQIAWIDAMHLCRWVLNSQDRENRPNPWSLETVAKEQLSWIPWVHTWLEEKATGKFTAARASGDAGVALLLAQWAWKQLTSQQRRSTLIEAQNLIPAAKAWLRGVPVNLQQTGEAAEVAAAELRELERRIGLTQKQLASPKQLKDILYTEWGLPVETLTPKGDWSTSKEALTYLSDRDPRILEIMRWRKVNTIETKFLRGIQRAAEHLREPLMHPQPRIFGTYTGRYTYSSKILNKYPIGFALHQQPRGPEIRRMVVVPGKYRLVELDASGQEMRLMADFSQDPTLLEIFHQGKNPHDVTGAAISPYDYAEFMSLKAAHDEQIVGPQGYRYCGKFINLSCQYRIGVRKLRIKARVDYDLRIDFRTANYWRDTYLSTYSGIRQYWDSAVRLARKSGFAETRAGRRMRLTEFGPDDEWSTDSTAINFPIQGTGADMKELAIALITTQFSDLLFAWDLHDGIFFWVPEHWQNSDLLALRNFLNEIDYTKYWGWSPSVPMVWDIAATSTTWGEMEEIQ